MMMEPGTYDAKTTAATIYEAPSGAVMCRMALDIGLTGGICLIQKDGTLSERGFRDAAAILGIEGGWDWALWQREPEAWAGHDVEAVVETVQTDKGEFSSVKYLNPPGGGNRLERCDAKSLAAKYGSKTRALFGGAPAAAAPAKPTAPAPKATPPPPPPSAPGKTATIEDAWAAWNNADDVEGFYKLIEQVTGKADRDEVTPAGWARVVQAIADLRAF